MDYLKAGLLVGAVGDIALQVGCKSFNVACGLRPYFEYQGPIMSVVKASLLTGGWSWVYGSLDPNPSLVRFIIFGGILDIAYRQLYPYIYPSLAPYYEYYPPSSTVPINMAVAGMVEVAKDYLL